MVAWLSWHCGIDAVTAREHLRVARRLDELPLVQAAFRAGQVSYSKVRALTRVATPATEADLVEIALSATAVQLTDLARGYHTARRHLDAAREDLQRGLHVVTDDDGTLVGRFRLAAEAGAAVMAAIRSVTDERTPEAFADALVGLVTQRLAPGERAALMVHVTAADLTATCDTPAGLVGNRGPAVTSEVVRRLGCDATLIASLDDGDGNPLRLGRRRRVVSRPLRRALHRRDRHCQFPGCTHARWVHAHHIRHWAHGGPTSLENLVLLCGQHHRAVHEHGWQIEVTPTGFEFMPPDPNQRIAHEPGHLDAVEGSCEQAPQPGWYRQPWDLPTCVEVLLWTEDRYHRAHPPDIAA
jgi:hypothetical protein